MRFLSGFLFGLLLGGTSPVPAEILYSVTDLGTFPNGAGTLGKAVNNAGQVTGLADIGVFDRFAFVYSNGQLTRIGEISSGNGINNAGQITGAAGGHAIIYSNGQLADLGTLGGLSSQGYAINDAGQVTGYSSTSAGDSHAFVYSNGQMKDLGTLAGDRISYGTSISNTGQVTGYSYTLSFPTTRLHAFLYSDGQMSDLGTLGGLSSQGLGINDAGQVTGYAQTLPGVSHAFVYEKGQMTDLGTLTGFGSSQGNGINKAGQVVGYSTTSAEINTPHAFVYRAGQMLDLNSLINPALRIRLTEATALNDLGQIVANDGSGYGEGGSPAPHAYLLTPVPEPGTLTLLGVALLGLGAWVRLSPTTKLEPRIIALDRQD
jgi:probable HAF family extracellular repeat protein